MTTGDWLVVLLLVAAPLALLLLRVELLGRRDRREQLRRAYCDAQGEAGDGVERLRRRPDHGRRW